MFRESKHGAQFIGRYKCDERKRMGKNEVVKRIFGGRIRVEIHVKCERT